mmetsp:Transcript_76571/g.212691  ORF Transcript_76571/g.212691 Transcript_76571/m.212691 type:complete len:348 (-) Transcript_76571:112-1155(-)
MGGMCTTSGFEAADSFPEQRTLDVTRSTEDNYSKSYFVGACAHIRPLLDYRWHKMYQPSRMLLQDELVERFATPAHNAPQPLLPWVIFTAGAMGAGKGYVRKWMADAGYWPLDYFVIVDPDEVRSALPEWDRYVASDPETAGLMTQKEAGCIAELIGYKALGDRRNVVFDGSLQNASWYLDYFKNLRSQFPGVRIMIVHIVAEKDEVIKRAEERGKATGRVVPIEKLLASMEATPRSVKTLAPYADFVCRVVNERGKDPAVTREPGAPKPPESIPLTWDLMRRMWTPLDTDGDGCLSREEVETAVALGIVTREVVATIDTNGDGAITKDEIRRAEEKARKAAGVHHG